MPRLSEILKNLFFVLIILQIAPAIIKGLKTNWMSLLEPSTKVGIVTIKGALTDSTTLVNNLKKFFEDAEIKAIVLKVDCPGGTAGASEALYSEIKAFKKEHMKPVVVWTQNICTSGAYYVACAADHIISTPSAFIGSIGAFIQMPQLKEFTEQFKVKFNLYGAGAYKSTFNPLFDTTPEQQKLLQGLADDSYKTFTEAIAQSRPQLNLGAVSTWAEGRVFTGSQAMVIGLIDEIGSQSAVERYIREKALIEGNIEWVRPACTSGFWKMINGDDCETSEPSDSSYISTAVTAACSYFEQRFMPMVRY